MKTRVPVVGCQAFVRVFPWKNA